MEGQLGVKLLFDLDSWIMASKLTASQTLTGPRDRFWECIKADNSADNATMQAGGVLDLPVTFRNPRKIRFELWSPVGPLPTKILPLSQEREQTIVCQLIAELKSLHCQRSSVKNQT